MAINDAGRLLVGAVLLGLAIFLSLNLGGRDSNQRTDTSTTPPEESENLPPLWQSSDVDALTAVQTAGSLARPTFQINDSRMVDPGPEPVNEPGPLPMRDRYRPDAPIPVPGGQSLVPVEPKPGFGPTIQFAGRVHIIRPGDTLQSLASEFLGTADRYLDIYLANRHLLSNPARLPEGVEIRIPE